MSHSPPVNEPAYRSGSSGQPKTACHAVVRARWLAASCPSRSSRLGDEGPDPCPRSANPAPRGSSGVSFEHGGQPRCTSGATSPSFTERPHVPTGSAKAIANTAAFTRYIRTSVGTGRAGRSSLPLTSQETWTFASLRYRKLGRTLGETNNRPARMMRAIPSSAWHSLLASVCSQ